MVSVTSWGIQLGERIGINGLPGRNTRTYFWEMATAVKSTEYSPRPTLCCLHSCPALGPNGNNRKNTTINQAPFAEPMYSNQIASHHTRTSLELSPIMQNRLFNNRNRKLYTFADKLQSAVVGLANRSLERKGYLSSGLIRICGLENSSSFFSLVIVVASEERDLRIIASMSVPL